MAIDTAEKRQSAPGVGRPFMRSHFPTTIDEQWRLGVGNVYNGNALAAVADALIAQARSISRFTFARVFGRVN